MTTRFSQPFYGFNLNHYADGPLYGFSILFVHTALPVLYILVPGSIPLDEIWKALTNSVSCAPFSSEGMLPDCQIIQYSPTPSGTVKVPLNPLPSNSAQVRKDKYNRVKH